MMAYFSGELILCLFQIVFGSHPVPGTHMHVRTENLSFLVLRIKIGPQD